MGRELVVRAVASAPAMSGEQLDRRRANADGGFSFVEIIVAVSMMGVVVLAILTATRTSIRASSISYQSAQIETVLLNAADRVQRVNSVVCDYEQYVDAAVPQGWDTALVTSSSQLLKSTLTGNPVDDWQPCVSANAADAVVRVTISATSPTGDITRTMVVVKSDVGKPSH